MSNGVYRLDDLVVDPRRRSVRRGADELEVIGLSFDLFAFLLRQGDQVVSFDALLEHVWAPAVVSEETVTQRVKLLRQSLGDDGRRPRYLRSVRGRGYQLCSRPQWIEGDAAAPDESTGITRTPPAPPPHVPSGKGLRWVLLLTSLPLVALGVLVWLRVPQRAPQPEPANTRVELLQRARYYAGIGQKDDIERAIALYETLLQRDARDAAAQTGLSFAYSARVCLYNQEPYWAERAEDLARSALALEADDSLAEAALAYSLDCRGQLAQAIAHYERAVARDPTARTDSAASLAYLYMIKGRLAQALQRNLALRTAPAQPRYLAIQIARNLELLGATAAAERAYARSFQLYPDNVFSNAAWPRCLFVQGRLGERGFRLAQARQRSEHPQLFLLQGELALLRGHRDEAAAAFASAAALRPPASLPQTLARLYATSAPDPAWLEQRRAALESGTNREDWPEDQLELALLRLARKDHAGAIAALHAAVDAGWRDRAYLQTSVLFQPLATEPGFAAVLESIAAQVQRERVAAGEDIAAAERGIP